MNIVQTQRNKPIGHLTPGTVFEYKNCFLMVIEKNPSDSNAVDLQSGQLCSIPNITIVRTIQASLVEDYRED